jgi:hypothetical protein
LVESRGRSWQVVPIKPPPMTLPLFSLPPLAQRHWIEERLAPAPRRAWHERRFSAAGPR